MIEVFVHCRTGSLENTEQALGQVEKVHCRTGSLEMQAGEYRVYIKVHCRTGSLEITHKASHKVTFGSLPHRQLRKTLTWCQVMWVSSLPHRQLRKLKTVPPSFSAGSLPHRQLRNDVGVEESVSLCSLPHRQFRNGRLKPSPRLVGLLPSGFWTLALQKRDNFIQTNIEKHILYFKNELAQYGQVYRFGFKKE